MANSTERSCSMLVFNDKAITAPEIKDALENGDAATKAAAMRKAITMLLAGEQLPQVRGGGVA
jgi:coatomer subunit beta